MQDDSNNLTLTLGLGILFAFLVLLALCVLVTILLTSVIAAQGGAQTVSAEPTPVPVTQRGAPPPAESFAWVEVASGFDNPLFVTHAGDGSGRMFVVEQAGLIWIVDDGTFIDEPFLDVSGLLPSEVFLGGYTERGLLGLAFHPDYEQNGEFFISHSDRDGHSVIARYHVSSDPNRADPDSAEVILTVEQPFKDHNGGNILFGADGYLYIGLGDGGLFDTPDVHRYGQDPSTLLAKILRIDVDSGDPYAIPPDNPFVDDPAFAPETWALGLRNPWRFSFDRATGDFYVGDVGQADWEEVSFVPAGESGANFGWSAYEGSAPYYDDSTPVSAVTMPFAEYQHPLGGCSVTGGFVYRGHDLPDLHGVYFYGDYCNGRVWTAYRDTLGTWHSDVYMQTPYTISSFGEDEQGELYIVDYKGVLVRLTAAAPDM